MARAGEYGCLESCSQAMLEDALAGRPVHRQSYESAAGPTMPNPHGLFAAVELLDQEGRKFEVDSGARQP